MRALSTRVSHLHICCCYLIPYMDVPDRRSWNSDLVCTREPHARSQLQSFFVHFFGRERCLVTSLPIVRQDKSGQATRKDAHLRPHMRIMVSLMFTAIRKPLRLKHGNICVQYAGYLAFMRHVSYTRASQYSIILSPPYQACAMSLICSPVIVLRSWCAEEL